MTELLEANAKTDFAVAVTVGMCVRIDSIPSYQYGTQVNDVNRCVRIKDGLARPFFPTTCFDDAMEALVLFLKLPSVRGHDFSYELRKILFGCSHSMPHEQTVPLLAQAGPLAICEAILAMVEKGGDS